MGFAAETDLFPTTIQEKLNRKPVDLLVANLVNSGFNGSAKQGFGTKEGIYKLATVANPDPAELPLSKIQLAEEIFKLIK